MKVRASLKSREYFMTVMYRVEEQLDVSVPVATEIVHAHCQPSDGSDPCSASGHGHGVVYGHCSHICALVQVGLNLLRPDGVIGVVVPGTAALCTWNVPGGGVCYPQTTKLSDMVFSTPQFNREAAPRSMCVNKRSDRSRHNPIPEPHVMLNNAHPVAKRLRSELYSALRESFAGTGPAFTAAPAQYRPARAKHTYDANSSA